MKTFKVDNNGETTFKNRLETGKYHEFMACMAENAVKMTVFQSLTHCRCYNSNHLVLYTIFTEHMSTRSDTKYKLLDFVRRTREK